MKARYFYRHHVFPARTYVQPQAGGLPCWTHVPEKREREGSYGPSTCSPHRDLQLSSPDIQMCPSGQAQSSSNPDWIAVHCQQLSCRSSVHTNEYVHVAYVLHAYLVCQFVPRQFAAIRHPHRHLQLSTGPPKVANQGGIDVGKSPIEFALQKVERRDGWRWRRRRRRRWRLC